MKGEFSIIAEQLSEFVADLIYSITEDGHQVAFIITSTSSTLHKTLRSSYLANLQIELLAPSQKQRSEVNNNKLSNTKILFYKKTQTRYIFQKPFTLSLFFF